MDLSKSIQEPKKENIFERLGLPKNPLILAPLAGVSDHPFRRICSKMGADLSYVEMISAAALTRYNQKTIAMLQRHSDESILGVQITAGSCEDMSRGVAILNDYPFETIDINMGCPVKKVVKVGCGSAALRDPEHAYRMMLAATRASDVPVSLKIRLGWDDQSLTYKEIAQAAEQAGIAWLTVHGRTRQQSYEHKVDLDKIREIKELIKIPLVGNGNLLTHEEAHLMQEKTGVDGLMISRGALGNPWLFSQLKNPNFTVNLDRWLEGVLEHIAWQEAAYQRPEQAKFAAVCMRKHILWYVKGWPQARSLRDRINHLNDIKQAKEMILHFVQLLKTDESQFLERRTVEKDYEGRFNWDPKYEMDRGFDRAVCSDHL